MAYKFLSLMTFSDTISHCQSFSPEALWADEHALPGSLLSPSMATVKSPVGSIPKSHSAPLLMTGDGRTF